MKWGLGILAAGLALFCLALPARAEQVEKKTHGELVSVNYAQSEYELTTTNNAWIKVRFTVTPSDPSFHARTEDFKVSVKTASPLEASLVRIKENEDAFNIFDVTFLLQSGLLPGEKSKNAKYTVILAPVGEHKELLEKGTYAQDMRVKYKPFDSYQIQDALDEMWVEQSDYGFAYANAGYLPASVIRMLKMELKDGQSMNVNFGLYGSVFTYDGLTGLKAQAVDFYASQKEHVGYQKIIEEAGFSGDVHYLRFSTQELTGPVKLYFNVDTQLPYVYVFDKNIEKFSRLKLIDDGHVKTFETKELTTFVAVEKPLPLSIVVPSTALMPSQEAQDAAPVQLVLPQEEGGETEGRVYRLKDWDEYYYSKTAAKVERYLE